MKLAIILPTMRPEMADNVISNWACQRAAAPLYAVLNGRADNPATAAQYRDGGAGVLVGPQSKPKCLALGIGAAQADGCTHVAFWDDDDIYTEQYLSTVLHAFQAGAEWAGQKARYVRTGEDRLWRVGSRGCVLGCCLSTKIGLGRWDQSDRCIGPEQKWAEAHGVPPVVLPPGHFAQVRSSTVAHVWPVSDAGVAQLSGGAVDLGPWDVEVVAQRRPEPVGRPVVTREGDSQMDLAELAARAIGGVPSKELAWAMETL